MTGLGAAARRALREMLARGFHALPPRLTWLLFDATGAKTADELIDLQAERAEADLLARGSAAEVAAFSASAEEGNLDAVELHAARILGLAAKPRAAAN